MFRFLNLTCYLVFLTLSRLAFLICVGLIHSKQRAFFSLLFRFVLLSPCRWRYFSMIFNSLTSGYFNVWTVGRIYPSHDVNDSAVSWDLCFYHPADCDTFLCFLTLSLLVILMSVGLIYLGTMIMILASLEICVATTLQIPLLFSGLKPSRIRLL